MRLPLGDHLRAAGGIMVDRRVKDDERAARRSDAQRLRKHSLIARGVVERRVEDRVAVFRMDHHYGAHALGSVEHIQNPTNAIAEFARVLRPNGRLVVSVPNTTSTALYQATQFASYNGKLNAASYTIGAITGAARTWKCTVTTSPSTDGGRTMWVEITLHFFCLVPLAYLFGIVLGWGVLGVWMGAFA